MARKTLRYDYTGDRRFLEGADWFGCHPSGLQLHFHDEVQVSVVWRGHRDYRVGSNNIRIRSGQLLIIRGLQPHAALPSMHEEVQSIEFYLAPAALSHGRQSLLHDATFAILDSPLLNGAAPDKVAEAAIDLISNQIISAVPSELPLSAGNSRLREAMIEGRSIHEAAEALGYTREGFIRAFARAVGMTPNAYKINRRLNLGRQLLRRGGSLAEVAHETGFSDQSHFGRAFLKHFGATPGHFRDAHSVR
jgi:AraC-like DNA-binding protein